MSLNLNVAADVHTHTHKMQANTAELLPAGDPLGVSWNGIPFGYGSEYGGLPSSDWITPLAAELESVPHGCGTVASQQKDYYQPMIGSGMHRISPLNSSSEAVETNSSEHAYPPFAVSYHHPAYHHHHHHQHHQTVNYGAKCYPHIQQSQQHQQQQQLKQEHQPSRKIPTNGSRYVPNGYYTPNGRTSATDGGSPMPQPSLYPSPPVQSHPAEESSYSSKLYSGGGGGLQYMSGDHVPPPPTMSFSGHTDPALSTLYSGSDHYQPYSVSSIGYEESGTPAFSAAALSPAMESTLAPQKYEAWSTESSVMQPMMSPMGYPLLGHAHSLAIKQEYIPPAYISPSPSSMAGGSSIKTELMSETSRSPPPESDRPPADGIVMVQQPQPLPPTACPSPQLPVAKAKRAPSAKPTDTPTAGKKSTRNSNNYGDQFACPECRRTFARQCGLTQHTKWHHSGEKPFRCLTCGKCFSAQTALDDHLERHTTTDKPYRCQHCPKAFFHKNDLRRHGFQHTGTAPHACRYCLKTFARKDHCHSHECSHERKIQRKERKSKGSRSGVPVSGMELPPVTNTVLDSAISTPVVELALQFIDTEQRIVA